MKLDICPAFTTQLVNMPITIYNTMSNKNRIQLKLFLGNYREASGYQLCIFFANNVQKGGGQTHGKKMLQFVKAFWHKIDIKNCLRVELSRC